MTYEQFQVECEKFVNNQNKMLASYIKTTISNGDLSDKEKVEYISHYVNSQRKELRKWDEENAQDW